jgi:hypothetical protein
VNKVDPAEVERLLKLGAYAIMNEDDNENLDIEAVLEKAGKVGSTELYSLRKS